MSEIEITQAELAKRLVQIIEGVGHDWSVNLTRLVDGVSEYTLTYHGEQTTHPDTEEAYARLRELQEAEKSAAVLEYVQNLRHEARAEALGEAAKVAASYSDGFALRPAEGWSELEKAGFETGVLDASLAIAAALRSGEREG